MKQLIALLLIVVFALSSSIVLAQDETPKPGWKKSLDTDFTLTQNSYSDNWTGGETGNITWVWNANGEFENQFTPSFHFRNTSRFSFGQTHIQDSETDNWQAPTKTTDLIDIENVGKFTKGWVVDPYVAFRIESQFVDASDTLADKKLFLTPLRLTESAGASRKFIGSEQTELLSRLGFAFRQTMTKYVIDTEGNTDSETTNDGGVESVTDLTMTVSDQLKYTSKLTLYKAFFFSESDEVEGTEAEDYWKAVDINWENKVSASVAKYVTVSLYVQLLYDKQIDLKGRFKQTLALGLTYKLF